MLHVQISSLFSNKKYGKLIEEKTQIDYSELGSMYSTMGCFISFISTYVKVADTVYAPHEPKRNGLILIIEMRTPNFIRTLCSGSCFRMMWYKIKIIDVSSTKYGVLKPTLQRIRRKFQSGRVFFF